MTQEEYEQLIDTVSTTYAGVKDASKADLSTFKKEMKERWRSIAKTAAPKKKAAKKAVKKAVAPVKKAAAKVVKAEKKVEKYPQPHTQSPPPRGLSPGGVVYY